MHLLARLTNRNLVLNASYWINIGLFDSCLLCDKCEPITQGRCKQKKNLYLKESTGRRSTSTIGILDAVVEAFAVWVGVDALQAPAKSRMLLQDGVELPAEFGEFGAVSALEFDGGRGEPLQEARAFSDGHRRGRDVHQDLLLQVVLALQSEFGLQGGDFLEQAGVLGDQQVVGAASLQQADFVHAKVGAEKRGQGRICGKQKARDRTRNNIYIGAENDMNKTSKADVVAVPNNASIVDKITAKTVKWGKYH